MLNILNAHAAGLFGLSIASPLLLWWWLSSWQARDVYTKFQRAGQGKWSLLSQYIPDAVQEGYEKNIKPIGKPFVVRWWAKDWLILPPRYLADLRSASWTELSFFQSLSDAFYLHTSIGNLYESDRTVEVVKRGINPRLPSLTPLVVAEIDFGFDSGLGDGKGWEKVTAAKFISKVMHRVAARVLVGKELCRDEVFLEVSWDFIQSIFITGLVIVKLPLGPLRGLMAWPLSLLHRWKLNRAYKMLLPVVKRRIQERRGILDSERPLDAIEWTLSLSDQYPRDNNPEKITVELLQNLWAGSASPGGLVTEMLYNVLTEPKYLYPLRQEAENALAAHGWSEKFLDSLGLQDSFIKETNRLHSTGSVTCSRTVLERPFTFSDGLVLPVGSRISFPIKAIQLDSDNFSDPLEFQGFRFQKGKDGSGAATMSTTNLAFGYGNHVCPGRFFAVRAVKLIFSKILLDFEVAWDHERKDRPPQLPIEGQFAPNQEQIVLFRRRERSKAATTINAE